MTVYLRGRRWHHDFMIDRRRLRGPIPEAATKREALEIEARLKHQVFEGIYGLGNRRENARRRGATLLSDFVEQVYLPWARVNKRSWRSDEYRSRVLVASFKGKAFRDITPIAIEQFKSERLSTSTKFGRSRSPNSVNRELELLSRIFSMAVDNELAATNPCRKVRKLRVDWQRDRYLSPEEEELLMSAFDERYPHLKPIVVIALNTGTRRGEILGLRWDEVDFTRNDISVQRTKSGKPRSVPMNSRVRQLMLELRAASPEATYVFGGPTGKGLTDIKHGFGSALRRAGITNFRFHDLRHSAATRMAMAGVDIFTVSSILGHATIQMTMRYAHATDERKRSATEVLADYPGRQKEPAPVNTHQRFRERVRRQRA